MVHKPALKNNLAFTLVELLITVSVLLILTTVTIVLINPTKLRSNANETKSMSELGTITNAMEFYYSDKQSYPLALASLITDNYIADSKLLVDDNNTSYCYLRRISGVSPSQKVNSYKLCTISGKEVGSNFLNAEIANLTVTTEDDYNTDQCGIANPDTTKVQCLQSPF